jgi:hypothetical protein
MNTLSKLTCIAALSLASWTTCAQISSGDFSKFINQEPSIEINLGPTMLGLLSSATDSKEQGISSILSSLTAINVIVFELNKSDSMGELRTQINKMAKLKTSEGFEKIATVKDDDSLVYIFAETEKDSFKSLNIFALDDEDELVLIEIKGSILMSQIGDLMNHFDVNLDLDQLNLNKD